MAFFYALRFDITANCVSPLRAAANGSDSEGIFHDKEGRAFIQASAIAGTMRSWFEKNGLSDEASRFFGKKLSQGELSFSDGIFSSDSIESSRTRLKINRSSKSLLTTFEISAMTRGSLFAFSILWKGASKEDSLSAELLLQKAFSAVNSGEILFGAQKSSGYGRVNFSVKKRSFDLRNPLDQSAWLEQHEAIEEFPIEEASAYSHVVFTVEGTASSIFSKAATKSYIRKNMIETNIKENDIFLLQSSSVKGAIRTRAEDIARNVFNFTQEDIDSIFGNIYPNKAFAGKIIFSDILLEPLFEPHIVSRAQIDRFTAGAMTGRLTSAMPLSSKTNFEICVPKDNEAACALILFALRDLGLGIYSLGSSATIGYGFLKLEKICASVPNGEEIVMVFGEDGAKITSGEVTAHKWLTSVKGRCHI